MGPELPLFMANKKKILMKAQKFADVLIIVGDVTVTDDGGKYKRALHEIHLPEIDYITL